MDGTPSNKDDRKDSRGNGKRIKRDGRMAGLTAKGMTRWRGEGTERKDRINGLPATRDDRMDK